MPMADMPTLNAFRDVLLSAVARKVASLVALEAERLVTIERDMASLPTKNADHFI